MEIMGSVPGGQHQTRGAGERGRGREGVPNLQNKGDLSNHYIWPPRPSVALRGRKAL